jgi:hypothetical protein
MLIVLELGLLEWSLARPASPGPVLFSILGRKSVIDQMLSPC